MAGEQLLRPIHVNLPLGASTRDRVLRSTQQSRHYVQPNVQVPSYFDGSLFEVPCPSQPLSNAQPAHTSVASLQAYYSPSFGPSLTRVSSNSSSSSASSTSHVHDYSSSLFSFEEFSPSLPSLEYHSASSLGVNDLSESISTLRPGSSFDSQHSTQHSTWGMLSHDKMAAELPRYQLQVFNVASESRTETQIRPRLAFIETSKTTTTDSDSISSCVVTEAEIKHWKYIRCPTSPKTKPVTSFEPASVLSLTARISCGKDPSVPIPCCKSCQEREARNQRKLSKVLNDSVRASIPSVLRGGSIIAEGANQGRPYVSPLEFNGDELIPLRSGAVDLSFRITCYCRHYGEPSGFRVLFTLTDYYGRVVGEVMTSPIMIIDNHKSKPKLRRLPVRGRIRVPDNASDNFQVTNPQGQTIRSYPPIMRVTSDSGPIRGGTQRSIDDRTFDSLPRSTQFSDHVTHATVDRTSVPGAIASDNGSPMNHGTENSNWKLPSSYSQGSWW